MTMQQEEQQILGYFIEEAREHINTIEQGLLNLAITLKDSEMMNEVFRAAHSLKGGASMLGLSSIQHTSHCLEDWFRILQEHPVKIDLNLESLLLDICDRLKTLIIYALDDNWQEEEILEDITHYQLLIADNESDLLLLEDEDEEISAKIVNQVSIEDEDFTALEALLDENEDNAPQISSKPLVISQSAVVESENTFSSLKPEHEFSEWEDLLTQSDLSARSEYQTLSATIATSRKTSTNKIPASRTGGTIREETIKIPVKQLDEINNLVGELVVNRNTLEQNHERLRQSVDTLLVEVQHLSEVGMRMQEYYEGSLLKASLLSSRRARENNIDSNSLMDSNSRYRRGDNFDHGFSEIEMDQFTPFHVLAQEMIEFIVRVRESASDIEFVSEKTEEATRQLGQATSRLQERLTKARMVPFSQVIDRLRQGVRDNAIKYGKQVELVTEGVHTLIDKMILDHLTYPLTHILNNAIAHGIETPQMRQAAGKSATGIISIRALQQVNQTVIYVSDDGVGIDHQEVKNKAIEKGIITFKQAKTMSRFDIYKLLFLPSFNTADEVDDIKGRGVGLNVVENDISHIRGRVTTDSTPGRGTTFTIFLPRTLSICRALLCACDRFKIAFPRDGVEDTLNIPANSQTIQQDINGESFIVWRDTKLPFKPLKDILVFNRQFNFGKALVTKRNNDMISVVVVRSGNRMLGLQIDKVLDEREIVIKQFEGPISKPIGVAGATVLGDGMIMPIADVGEIIDLSHGQISKHTDISFWQRPASPTVDISTPDQLEKKERNL